MTIRHKALHLRDLLLELLARDFKLRYHRSYLGVAWSLLKPLSQLLVFLLVFGRIMPLGIKHYPTFLFAGVLAWAWFSSAVLGSALAVTGNPELVRRPGFPALILPLIVVLGEAIHFAIALPLLIVAAWVDIGRLSLALLALPLVIVAQALLIAGIGYFVAAAHVRYRDTQDAANVLLMLAFYLTPVFYDPSAASGRGFQFLAYNPMAIIVGAYRDILIDGVAPNMLALGSVALLAGCAMAVGVRLFNRASTSFVEEL